MSGPQPYTIPSPVLEVLADATVEDTAVRLPDAQLDRDLYVQVDEVLSAIGGTWNRHQRAHLFDASPAEELDVVLRTGTVYRHKDYQYFPTPAWLASILAEMAFLGIDVDRTTALEPSAGTGALIDAARPYLSIEAWTCYEINPTQVDVLRAKGLRVEASNFLASAPDARFDAVVMNPPFSRGQDIAHVSHAWQHLAPGGRLVAIMSRGTRTATTKKARAFQALVDAHGWFEDVPAGAFAESGTQVATTIVVLDREA